MTEREALEIINKYLEQVAVELPEDIRDEVIEELRTHIIDMTKDMGGLTPENALRAIESMGDPKKLAEEFLEVESKKPRRKKDFEISFRLGEKVYRFGFSVDSDLMDSIYNIMKILMILLVVGFLIRVVVGILFYPLETDTIGLLVDAIGSLIIIYILFNMALWVLSELAEEKKPAYKVKVKKVVKERKMEVAKTKEKHKTSVKGGGLLVGGGFVLTLGVGLIWMVEYISRYHTLSWVTKLLWLSFGIVIIYSGIITISRAFSYIINGEDSPFLRLLDDISSLFLIPSLLVINIYPEEVQYPYIRATSYESFREFISSIQIRYVPSDFVPLVQLLSILFIVLITVSIVYSIIKYNKEKKEKLFLKLIRNDSLR